MHTPRCFLDEPTASLDATNREIVLTLIEEAKARGAAIIGIFHDEAARDRVCDREIDVSRFHPGNGRMTSRTPHRSCRAFRRWKGQRDAGHSRRHAEPASGASRHHPRPGTWWRRLSRPSQYPEFEDMVENGAFAVHWCAHELRYGIPFMVKYQLNRGTDCLANFSRKALHGSLRGFCEFQGSAHHRPARNPGRTSCGSRSRTEGEIAKRLAQAEIPLPAGLDVITLSNDGPLEQTVARAMTLLQPASV